ncbi:hypothetical protein B0H10DRAFT_1957082 [Mycena sp. CBHHK59/15]|nr:hypothetical protein B0H10DRAFT_1957082 [Mycena sp. CBHHK59/15]
MGNTGSSLPSLSQAGSALQLCLNNLSDVKPYNTNIPVIPAAVTRPTTSAEVAQIVQCAVASAVKVQARSGGHSYGNYGKWIGGEDNAVVVDMMNFQQYSMTTRPGRRPSVPARPWRISRRACTMRAAVRSPTGLARRWASEGTRRSADSDQSHDNGARALDHVLEVEMVLVNGTVTRASATQNPDITIRSAVKGAAASFGIVTEFVFLTHPEPPSAVRYSYTLEYVVPSSCLSLGAHADIQLGKHAALASTFAAWQAIVADPALDRKLASEVIVFELGMVITGTYFGTRDEYNALNFEQRLTQNATTVSVTVFDDWLGMVGNWAETEALKLVAAYAFYSKGLTFTADTLIPANGIQDLFNYFDSADKSTLLWFAIFGVEGGAVNDVAQDATAYAHRDALFYMQTYAISLSTLSNTTTAFVIGIGDVVTGSMPGVQFGGVRGPCRIFRADADDPSPKLTDGPQQYWARTSRGCSASRRGGPRGCVP